MVCQCNRDFERCNRDFESKGVTRPGDDGMKEDGLQSVGGRVAISCNGRRDLGRVCWKVMRSRNVLLCKSSGGVSANKLIA